MPPDGGTRLRTRWMSRLLRIPEAAAELSIGRSRLYELIAAGELQAVKIGERGVRVPQSELDRFVAERLTNTSAARTAGSDQLDG
jgi:excisionase family DNA binding protein